MGLLILYVVLAFLIMMAAFTISAGVDKNGISNHFCKAAFIAFLWPLAVVIGAVYGGYLFYKDFRWK